MSVCEAYVDGSYQNNRVGYGFIILKDDKREFSEYGRLYKYNESHQVGGELEATMRVLKWCQENKIDHITIYYDYVGIEKWAIGSWKAKKPVSINYKKFIDLCSVKINWEHVKSHTGNKYNELADSLAKKGAMIN